MTCMSVLKYLVRSCTRHQAAVACDGQRAKDDSQSLGALSSRETRGTWARVPGSGRLHPDLTRRRRLIVIAQVGTRWLANAGCLASSRGLERRWAVRHGAVSSGGRLQADEFVDEFVDVDVMWM